MKQTNKTQIILRKVTTLQHISFNKRLRVIIKYLFILYSNIYIII